MLPNIFIYKKPDTFQKARQFPLHFCVQKAWHFTLRDFSWKFWIWYLYTKSMTLCVLWRFYIHKAGHSAKSKKTCVTFLYTKWWTLCVIRFFIEFLKLAEGGNFQSKKYILCVEYLYPKNTALCVMFLIQKSWHFALHIYIKKQCTLRYVFISKIYRIVLIVNPGIPITVKPPFTVKSPLNRELLN